MFDFISFWPEKKTTAHNNTEKRICREIKIKRCT